MFKNFTVLLNVFVMRFNSPFIANRFPWPKGPVHARLARREFLSQPDHISFVETVHDITSMAILPLPQIYVAQLLVTGEGMCTK